MPNKDEQQLISEKSKSYALQIWDLISAHVEKNKAELVESNDREGPPRVRISNKWVLRLLLAFPLLLVSLFVLSFFWDFDGLSGSVFGYAIRFEGLLSILTISGLIGFATNWVAITMLFRPARKRPLLGHGLIPAQKDRIAFRLARAVSEDLINPEIIKRKIHESKAITKYREKATEYVRSIIDDPTFRHDLKALTYGYVDEMIANPEVRASIAKTIIEQIEDTIEENSFEKVALKAYSFIKGQEMQEIIEEAIQKLPGSVEKGLDKLDDYLDTLPDRIDANSDVIENVVTNLLYKLINQLDVHQLVEDNLRQYDEHRLEMLIKNASNDQLKFIQYLGAVLGTVGGFVIWEPFLSLGVLVAAAVLIISTDFIILSFRKSTD
jgi:uncharacterized membrane protein YheB (UPF0754 family)